MRLSTYNFLTSKAIKGVKVGYPLKLTIHKQTVTEVEFNVNFIKRLLPRLNWSVIKLAAEQAGLSEDIPEEQPERLDEVEGLLEKLHHLLLEVDVLEGELQCPETGRIYQIKDGIPNMLLNEDEV